MALFGLLGYVLVKLDCEPAPLMLGFILGPLMEENLRRAMLLSRGDPMVFLDPADQRDDAGAGGDRPDHRPQPGHRRKREEVFQEDA